MNCDNDRRNVTAPTALILARVFGNSPDFWLNVQRRGDLWNAMHSPRERERIKRARPLTRWPHNQAPRPRQFPQDQNAPDTLLDEQWRRRRDSNPRDPFESNGFQDG